MTQSFNLIDQPWIPCEVPGGGFVELGLRDTLAQAHQLRGISADSPLETASLYRLLLAVLHRVFGPASTAEWFDLWRAGAWDSARLDEYWAQWYEHFDLLHPDEGFRFYQRRPPTGEPGPIIHMMFSSGNNPALFSHVTDVNQPGLTLPQAARAVVAAQVFRPGGFIKGQSGKDDKSGYASPAQKGITFLIEGQSLFATTLFNIWQYSDWNFSQVTGIPQTQQDAPAWEQGDVFAFERDLPFGYLDYLSWQSFRIWLEEPEGDGRIYQVRLGKGQSKVRDTVYDPFKHYTVSKTSGYQPLNFSEDRALWRDSAAILEQANVNGAQAAKQPYCIAWFATLFDADDDGALGTQQDMPLMALGMASDQAKIDFYRQERLPLPAAYLQEQQLVVWLKKGLKYADQTGQALSSAIYRLAERIIAPDAGKPEGRKPRREDVSPLVRHWGVERQYWGAIEPDFLQFVADLPRSGEEALAAWFGALIQAARRAYESAEEAAGSDARALKAAAAGRSALERHLAPLRKEIEQWQIEQKNLSAG